MKKKTKAEPVEVHPLIDCRVCGTFIASTIYPDFIEVQIVVDRKVEKVCAFCLELLKKLNFSRMPHFKIRLRGEEENNNGRGKSRRKNPGGR